MVPEPVVAVRPPDLVDLHPEEAVELRRVGAGGSMAPDNAFAVALLTLWHGVARGGGAVGFPTDVARAAVGGAIAPVVDAVKSGRSFAVAAAQHRHVVGFALLERGTLDRAHTATMSLVMVQPSRQGMGLGRQLVDGLLATATTVGIERIQVLVPAAGGLDRFFGRFGFVECGRLPGWFRAGGPGDDALVLVADVPPAAAGG